MQLMRDFSVEMTPSELARCGGCPAQLPAGSRVYVPWIPGNRFEHTLRAVVRLRELGMTPVPHLAVRAIADAGALELMLQALKREAGVDQALLIAGSQREPAGSFDNTLQALAAGLFEAEGFSSLGLAAHPEGSPDIDTEALALALTAKNAYAVKTSLHMHLVTQFCFAAQPIVTWQRQAFVAGNRLPVHVGLAGLASLPTLIKYARSCGVGASIAVLTRQAGRLLKLASKVHPGEIVVAVARARLTDPDCLFERFHLFPFGSLEATVEWAAAVARGEFVLGSDNTDLTI